jgi:6-phosphogluconolactonase
VDNTRVFPNPNDLIDHVAAKIVSIARSAIGERGGFFFMLSGGSTPRLLYERISDPLNIRNLDWAKTHVFWGDERCVPPEHKDSNYRMAHETLLDKVPILPENVHRIHGELPPQTAADRYEGELRRSFHFDNDQGPGGEHAVTNFPVFDLILLGMGTDGHTASLFPGSSGLNEEERWFVAVAHDTPPPPLVARVTATPGMLNAGSNVFFLVTGAKKASRLVQVLEGPFRPNDLPAQIVKPENGQLTWFIDQEAASGLSI